MPKKTKRPSATQEPDSAFLLKLVLYLIIGSQWLHFVRADGSGFPVPVGLLIGFAFALHEHFQIDRKIEYAILLVAMLVGFWSQAGIYIGL